MANSLLLGGLIDRNDGSIMIMQSLININLSIYCSAAGNDLMFAGERVELAKYRPQRHESIRTKKSCREYLMDVWCSSKSCGGVVGCNRGRLQSLILPVIHVSSYVIIDNMDLLCAGLQKRLFCFVRALHQKQFNNSLRTSERCRSSTILRIVNDFTVLCSTMNLTSDGV